jgi:hypothetical protein
MNSIGKQKTYNETLIIKQFKNEPFINQLGVAKNYLQNFILKGLRQYHGSLRANIECKNILIDVEILFWKGQYKLADKLINKGEKIAQKFELFLLLEEIDHWKGRINAAIRKLDNYSSNLVKESNSEHMDKYSNIQDYRHLINQTQKLLSQSEVIRTEDEKKNYERLLNNDLMKDSSVANSYESRYSYYVLKSVLLRKVGKQKESGEYRKKLVDYLESQPHLLQENPIHYTAAVHNLLMHSLIIKDYELYELIIPKLREHSFKSPHVRASIFTSLCLFELGYFNETGQFDKAKYFIENTVNSYTNIYDLLNTEHDYLLHYHSALAYFYLGEYREALKWINDIINYAKKDLRVDIQASALILNILIHYELGNNSLIEYLIKNSLQFFRKNNMLNDIDEIFIKQFKQIPNSKNKKEFIKFLIGKKEEINALESKETIVSDVDYVQWIESKLTNTLLIDLYKNKTTVKN